MNDKCAGKEWHLKRDCLEGLSAEELQARGMILLHDEENAANGGYRYFVRPENAFGKILEDHQARYLRRRSKATLVRKQKCAKKPKIPSNDSRFGRSDWPNATVIRPSPRLARESACASASPRLGKRRSRTFSLRCNRSRA